MNEAEFGLRFSVKGAKQVQKTLDELNNRMKKMGDQVSSIGNKIDELGESANKVGKEQDKVLGKGSQNANKMANALDRVLRKWISIGGAITLVSMLASRAFRRVDEIIGINRMSASAGASKGKIYGLGQILKEKYGGDASSAASAYTSLGDILGAARSGRGISQDVVSASARYGIALNGGMLSQEQLMTNIAIAMQAQRNKGNMYGVRDIAHAFGIDEAMMLHLSQRGKNWDKGLPAYNAKQAEKDAMKAKQLQANLERVINELAQTTLPLINLAMKYIIRVLGKFVDIKDEITEYAESRAAQYKASTITTQERYDAVFKSLKSAGYSDEEADRRAKDFLSFQGIDDPNFAKRDYSYIGKLEAARLKSAQDLANYYNANPSANILYGLDAVKEQLKGVTGTSASLYNTGKEIKIVIEDKAGVLRNMYLNGKLNVGNTINISGATK